MTSAAPLPFRRRYRRWPVLLLLASALVAWPAAASAFTYVVRPDGGGDFQTIQAALDASGTGDEVVLTDGTFSGESNLDFHGRGIVLRSESGDPHACIFAPGSRGFYLHSGETRAARIEGITILEGYDYYAGGGAYLANASPTFVNCRFDNCCADSGNAIYALGGSLRVQNCEFACSCFVIPTGEGGAIYASAATLEIEGCHFYWSGTSHGGEIYATDCDLTVSESYFGPLFGSYECFFLYGGTARFTYCTVADGYADTLFRLEGTSLLADHSIFANGWEEMTSVVCTGGASAEFSCCDVFGFPGGNWIGCLAGQQELNHNLDEDPLFCAESRRNLEWETRIPCSMEFSNLTLRDDSPCVAANNPDCGRIGALEVGCYGPVPVQSTSWGRIKSLYRP